MNLHQQVIGAFFQNNGRLVDCVQTQALANPLTCLGDGHDGIWNLYSQIGTSTQRREVLGWYHLVENLGKVGGSQRCLEAVEQWLWQGNVDKAMAQFRGWHHKRVKMFMTYLEKHGHRIVNYAYY